MNPLANIWQHPRTSASGLLIALVTVCGVLSQQGITLGNLGTGTVLSLTSALATALLGLLARDPESGSENKSTTRLGVLMLILLLIPLPWTTGCTAKTVAQQIVDWTPALQTAVATIDSTASLLDPSAASAFTAATAGFNAAANLLASQAKAYLATPGATTLAALQAQVVALEQQVNTALLSAARISNSASQKQALNAINAVMAIVSAILALIASISSKAAKARMAVQAKVKLRLVEPYLDREEAARIVARQEEKPLLLARMEVKNFWHQAALAGF